MVCMLEGLDLPSQIDCAIPTFGVSPSNTNYLAACGVFTNNKDGICTFPKSYAGNSDGENTITPYVMGYFVTHGVTARSTIKCKNLNGAKIYICIECPQVTTLYFAAATGPKFSPYLSAVSSLTTTTDSVKLYHADLWHQYNGDIGMAYEPTLDNCIKTCASREDCVNVAWVPGSPGPCYLKGEDVGNSIPNNGVWGALKAKSSGRAVGW
ncbi:hypothetical protein MPH_08907 [Macrophomina phaseolina MS6]|uniref:Apple domain-containing protein n=1 Tax=Macrophomina phaseolina (strain MS6) TaxID=1126212 RepID=K2RH44_MACPH|nr:hypothetical protein MPH_08907 [Macrophomina phaseolina MS6]